MRRVTKIKNGKANMISENVRKYRTELGYTQQDLTDHLQLYEIYICRGSIARIESGERTVTDIELWGISQVLEKSVLDLFKESV